MKNITVIPYTDWIPPVALAEEIHPFFTTGFPQELLQPVPEESEVIASLSGDKTAVILESAIDAGEVEKEIGNYKFNINKFKILSK
ncbi:hypothetical protein Barb6XT_02746 [Bacteroidales bacterium Barb6XT]|nr:hypothetical protein Barb6XT_02746 [Bacteroidales bacterium Barb6XT]